MEVTLIPSGQRHKGVISATYPSIFALGVIIGGETLKLQAEEEFKTFTLRVMTERPTAP